MRLLSFKQLSFYFHTLCYLKSSQLLWQCIRRIYHPKISLLVNTIQINETVGIWVQSIKSNHQFFDDTNITFLNHSMPYDENIWKNCKKQSRLWQYNLHYFQGLLSSNPVIVESTVQLLESWLIAFPVSRRTPAVR